MPDVLAEVQALKTKAQEAERQKVKNQADIDSMEGRLRESLERMRTDYGATSVAVAKEMVSALEADLHETIRVLRATLEESA